MHLMLLVTTALPLVTRYRSRRMAGEYSPAIRKYTITATLSLPTTAFVDTSTSAGPAGAERSPGAHTSTGSRVLDLLPRRDSQASELLQAPLASWPFPLLDVAW